MRCRADRNTIRPGRGWLRTVARDRQRRPRAMRGRGRRSSLKSHTPGGLGRIVAAIACLSAAPLFAQTAPPNANAGRALESATPPQPREIKKDADVLPPTDTP